jgi:hypothetical protein
MPKVFRVMRIDRDKPMVGASKTTLGVVVASPEAMKKKQKPDVTPNEQGEIVPDQSSGMSVSPSLATLPVHLLPPRFRHLNRNARGDDRHFCWTMGDGVFQDSNINENLTLFVDNPDKHGLVQPAIQCAADTFQSHIAATVDQWIIDEGGTDEDK